MQNALKMAAGILGVCFLCVLLSGHPAAAQQQPATQQTTEQPAPPAPAPAPAPPPPVVTQAGQFYGGDGWSVTLQYWQAVGHPTMGTGHANTSGEPSTLDYGGKPRPSPGAVVSVPVGKHHAIRVRYFRMQGIGNPTAPEPVIIFGTNYYQGDYLATNYLLQNLKISLDYLSWPFPIKDSKFHIKTLWEVQYTNIKTNVDAPLRHGETDASGNAITTTASGEDWFIFPSFGLGIDYLASQKLRFEARASGFIFPHGSTLWDTEASLNYRFGKFEIEGGAKAFHFKTSPAHNEFVESTFPGVYVGLRWYPLYGRR